MLNTLVTVWKGPPVRSEVFLEARGWSVQVFKREVPVFNRLAKRVRNGVLIESRLHQKAAEPSRCGSCHSGLAIEVIGTEHLMGGVLELGLW